MGRAAELSRLNRLVAAAKDGRSGSIVVRGEAGIGKTALLDHAAGIAGGMRVLRVAGVESEAEIPFAGIQLLFGRFTDRLDALPGPQAEALRAALGHSSSAGDRLLVGAAVLSLLADLADDGPVLCLVDDAHWFDRSSAEALLFAVRRLHSDPVATVLAVRSGDRPFPADGIDGVELGRLDRADSARLLETVRALPAQVADRVLTESGGNPLAILELAATDESPAPVAPLPATGRLEEHFRNLIGALPDRTRLALLLAAADDRSDLGPFAAAAERLGLDATDLGPAEERQLVRVTSETVAFRHPLIRAAAYQREPLARRVSAHQALAATLSDPRDGDRRAWHLAAAATGPDETAADELELAARRAVVRGAPAAAARALERAAQLSSGREGRAGRLVEAARNAYDAGQLDRAAELASAGSRLTEHPGDKAEADWVLAQVAYERDSPAAASALALDAAAPILTADPYRAVAVLIEATWCARDAGDPELLGRCAGLVRSVQGGPVVVRDALAGFTDLLRGDVGTAVAPLRALLLATVDGTLEQLLAGFAGVLIGADATALELLDDLVAALRNQGALGWLPYAQEPLAFAQLAGSRFQDAESSVTEAMSLAAELGQGMQVVVLSSISAWLAAIRGDVLTARERAQLVLDDTRQHRMATAQAHWALALTDLMTGEPGKALDRLDEVCAGPPGRDVTIRAIPDHVEAAVRGGDAARARTHLPQLAAWAEHTGSPVARGLVLRCEALLCEDAPDLFEAALAVDGCAPYDRARTQLVYAEWLRRHRRPTAARAQLVAADETFERIAAHGWQQRVRAELVALGDSVPETPATDGVRLTPQELQVVRRAAEGMSNREIAAQLFLSPRTVGHHLYKAYPKLGVSRRSQLGRLDL